jgi:hypothetical protein
MLAEAIGVILGLRTLFSQLVLSISELAKFGFI